MKIVFTKHVNDKLKEKEIIELGIREEDIIDVINKPDIVDKTVYPHQSVGPLTKTLSLSVIWKIENNAIKVVTCYPARKGRYEGKILRRR